MLIALIVSTEDPASDDLERGVWSAGRGIVSGPQFSPRVRLHKNNTIDHRGGAHEPKRLPDGSQEVDM